MGAPVDKNLWGELEPEEGVYHPLYLTISDLCPAEEEEESDEESDEEEEAETQPPPTDGMQTPSGLETPSGMTSVVSTVAGGLETPDFLELRKNSTRAASEAEMTGPRSLYQVVPEKQTSIRGMMGSERGYDVSAVAGAPIPVLGDERGTKVSCSAVIAVTAVLNLQRLAQSKWSGHFDRCWGTGRSFGR